MAMSVYVDLPSGALSFSMICFDDFHVSKRKKGGGGIWSSV